MKKAGKDTKLSLLTSTGPAAVRTAVIEKQMLEAAGFTVTLEIESEADLISRAIGGDFDLAAFRNQPGDDPDSNFHWWDGGANPVNFGRFDDSVINDNLRIGRQSPRSRQASGRLRGDRPPLRRSGLQRVPVVLAVGGGRGRQRARDPRPHRCPTVVLRPPAW